MGWANQADYRGQVAIGIRKMLVWTVRKMLVWTMRKMLVWTVRKMLLLWTMKCVTGSPAEGA